MAIMRKGLKGMGRLGPMTSVYPTWDARCELGQRFSAGSGYDLLLVFDAPAVDLAIGQKEAALFFNRVGTLSSSTTIPGADTLSQVIIMGQPASRRPARNLVIFDARFKKPGDYGYGHWRQP